MMAVTLATTTTTPPCGILRSLRRPPSARRSVLLPRRSSRLSSTASPDGPPASSPPARVDGGEEEAGASSFPPQSPVRSSAHGTPIWREFALAATGDWGGCCVEFDADGVALDIPLRFVHGVGRVPAANMPFRDVVTDWMTKCDVVNTEDGLEVRDARGGGGGGGGALVIRHRACCVTRPQIKSDAQTLCRIHQE